MEVENDPIAYKTSFLYKRAIFHFHDYGRKGSGRIRQWSLLVANRKQYTILKDISFKFTIHLHCLISPKWVIYYSDPSTPTILNPKKKNARPSELHSQLFPVHLLCSPTRNTANWRKVSKHIGREFGHNPSQRWMFGFRKKNTFSIGMIFRVPCRIFRDVYKPAFSNWVIFLLVPMFFHGC